MHGAPEFARPELGARAALQQKPAPGRRHVDGERPLSQARVHVMLQFFHVLADDGLERGGVERPVGDHRIDPVDKLG